MNPHKWKKYSLEDADISENTNTSAAFAFLSEIEKRKQQQDGNDDDDGDDDINANDQSDKVLFNNRKAAHNKLKFNRSVQQNRLRDELEQSKHINTVEDAPVMKGSKLVMPEYVIGQKTIQKEKRKKPTSTLGPSTKQLKLQHLLEEDEDDDD